MRRSANRKNGKRGCYHRLQGCYIFFAILMILTAILVPNFIRARAQGQYTACKSNLHDIYNGVERYKKDNEQALPPGLGALVPGHLKRIPTCPAAETNTYFATFGPGAPFNEPGYKDYVLLECMGRHHESLGVKADFPKYTTTKGLVLNSEELDKPAPASPVHR